MSLLIKLYTITYNTPQHITDRKININQNYSINNSQDDVIRMYKIETKNQTCILSHILAIL